MHRALLLSVLLSVLALPGQASDGVATEGKLSDKDFFRLATCGATPGGDCDGPVVRWAQTQITLALAAPSRHYPSALAASASVALDRAINEINGAGGGIRITRDDRLIEPDIIVMSKAVGGGLPMALLGIKRQFDAWAPGAHTGTFRGNQMAMAAGSAVIHYLVEHRLAEHAEAMGLRLRQHLQQLQRDYPQLGDVRGRGLMLGVELVEPQGERDALGYPQANRELAAKVQRECLKRGLILELGGRHGAVVRFLPPLIISAEQIDDVAQRFAEALIAAV